MASRRPVSVAVVALGALALSGCVLQPPALVPGAPATSAPATQAPAPSATESAPEPSATESTEPADPQPSAAATGSTVTIDGQPVGSWGGAIECAVFGETALLSASDDSGSMFGTGSNETGSWQAVGMLLNDGTSSYVQRDESVAASYDGATFSTEFAALDLTGRTVTIALSTPC